MAVELARGTYVVLNLVKNAAAPLLIPLWRSRGRLGADGDIAMVLDALDILAAGFESAPVQIEGARVLELGPGRTAEVTGALILAGAASAVGLDRVVGVPSSAAHVEHYRDLKAALTDGRGDRFLASVGSSRERVNERWSALRGQPWPVKFESYEGVRIPAAESSFQLVVSKSVLEHVPSDVVATLLAEMRRVLDDASPMVHYVDLRDHMHISSDAVVHGDWLDALTYPDWLFSAMFSNRSTAINRFRAPEWRALIARAEMEITGWAERRFPLPHTLDRDRLQPRWRDYDDDTLAVGSVCFSAIMRSGGGAQPT